MDSHVRPERSRTVVKKLQKRRKPQRFCPVNYPHRLRPGPDAHEDVTATNGPHARMNQSVFSLVAAAGSKTDFHSRFGEDDDSSGSETEHEELGVGTDGTPGMGSKSTTSESSRPTAAVSDSHLDQVQVDETTPKDGAHKQSESRLLGLLPKLRIRSHREKNYMTQSMILPPKSSRSPTPSPGPFSPRNAPVMSRMIKAQEALPTSAVEKADEPIRESWEKRLDDSSPKLMNRLMEIFSLKEAEEITAEYPCWLLQSVLLQGYMYITTKHICFYAYLPKKSNVVAKSGSLMKKGRQSPKYSRLWFILKGDILSYYDNPSSLYFPTGHVDLRYGVSAFVTEHKDKAKESKEFTITTPNRTYYFKADSGASAKEWVKALQKVIFRTNNDGDSVKIALPIENVIDIEESPVIDFADTFKVRVFDSDETFAVDEVSDFHYANVPLFGLKLKRNPVLFLLL